MDSVEQLAERLDHVLACLGYARRALSHADIELNGAAQQWESLFRESADPDTARLGSVGEQAVGCLAEQVEALQAVEQHIQRYLADIGVRPAEHAAATQGAYRFATHPGPDKRSNVGSQAKYPDTEQARVAHYRRQLEHPWPYGRPLRGWLLTSDDDHELASGMKLSSGEIDPEYEQAVRRSRELGLARSGFVPDIARHIEIKQAASMSQGETRTVVIGKDPCGIDPVTNVSCHKFLPYFLPKRATLIVYGPAGEPYRYEGKSLS